ncbi:hypothetical protein TCON_1689 [Astathelohania contejeani]|uniref:Uncharacterized protein n=1 Tax=Astathelohania contejeani TaxID=164912 RepID=A0ABQ7HY46_9MICR|nr:hypothetical protein TCON_1689 [Thelohania contejeani]
MISLRCVTHSNLNTHSKGYRKQNKIINEKNNALKAKDKNKFSGKILRRIKNIKMIILRLRKLYYWTRVMVCLKESGKIYFENIEIMLNAKSIDMKINILNI